MTATIGANYQPNISNEDNFEDTMPLSVDPSGNLMTRAQVLTDEGGYRVNFANASTSIALGNCDFTPGEKTVVGAGFTISDVNPGDYIKLDADTDAWTQVDSIDDGGTITLVSPYPGAGGTGASSRSILKPVAGAGATITVASGQATIAAGTTASSVSELERDCDWLPIVKQCGVTISQRIANQSIYIGFYDELNGSAPRFFAWFLADGTTNTTIKCQSARNPTTTPSASETETTTVTLPNGLTTATSNRYRVEVLGDKVAFFINGTPVATHYRAVPAPGDLLTSTVRVVNGTTPATNTNVVIDYDFVKNHNKLEVGNLSESTASSVVITPDQAAVETVAPVILVPPTNPLLSSAGTVQAQVVPGGLYTFCISIDKAVLGATANTVASCTTTAFDGTNLTAAQTVTTANTASLQVGTLLAGTGIVPGSYVTSISAGVSFTMSLPANASGTVTLNISAGAFAGTFQSSPDGSNWSNINVIPKTFTCAAVSTSSFVAPGLYQYQATSTDKFLRFNLTSINSTGPGSNLSTFRLRFDIDAFDRSAGIVNLPYVAYIAATAATYPTGLPVIMPVDVTGIGYLSAGITALAGTSQTITWKQTGDPFGQTTSGQPHITSGAAQNAVAITATATGEYQLAPTQRFLYANMSGGTAVSSLTFSGVVGHVGAQVAMGSTVNTINNQPINVSQIGGGGAVCSTIQGSSNTALGVYVGGSNNSTLTTTAFAGNGATNGATQAFTAGGGSAMAFDINVSSLTLGTATSVIFSIEESYDNGTTYSSIWSTDPVTATGHVRVPPLLITGRVRLRAWSVGGTSTTVTTATNVMASGASPTTQRYMADIYAATNPFTSNINGTSYASTLVSTTLNSVSAVALMEGCKNITLTGVFSGGTPTTGPTYAIQISQDATNWFTTTTTMTPGTTAGTYSATLANTAARFARVIVTVASSGGTPFTVGKISLYGTN